MGDTEYVWRLLSLKARFSRVVHKDIHTYTLDRVAFDRSLDRHRLLTNFYYWSKKSVFERPIFHRFKDNLFVLWHCVNFFEAPPLRRQELFVNVLCWWADSDSSRLQYLPTPAVFAYYSSQSLDRSLREILMRVSISEQSVLGLV